MTTVEERIAAPERPGGQGLDVNQEESGNRAIIALLTDPVRGEQTDLVMTWRGDPSPPHPLSRARERGNSGAYEVWAKRGMVRFVRFLAPEGGYGYRVIEQVGENPIANQDPTAVSTLAEELEAGAKSGNSGTEPAKAFVEPEQLSYPLAYERIAQLFDSPNAPDIAISPKSYAFGQQPGQHGSLDVVQSRAPLVFSGPGVTAGVTDAICAQVDVAPTLAKLLGLPLIDGMDSTGRTSSERAVGPDVYLKRQDGRVIEEILQETGNREQEASGPGRAYIFLLDGLSNTELQERLEHDREAIPNLSRLIDGGVMFRYGTTVNFPSITWPSHNTLGSGAWCGHHDVVNPTYYLRETRETVTPQGQVWDTAKYVSDEIETLYEAVHRVCGTWDPDTGEGVITASLNEPCVRGAAHATLERRLLVDEEALRETARVNRDDTNPRWKEEGKHGVYRYSGSDIQAMSQSLLLFDSDTQPPPVFTFHEFSLTDAVGHEYGPHDGALRDALIETDKRIGKILSLLERRGLFESTLFVISADHGMAPQKAELAADPAQAVIDAGLKAVVDSPLIYLIDMDVTVEAAPDGRTATVTVVANDVDARGERPAVAGALVSVVQGGASTLRSPFDTSGRTVRDDGRNTSAQDGSADKAIAEGRTDAHGVCGLALPVGVNAASLVVRVEHEGFNARHLRLDGSNVVEDVRERLYGGR